MFIRTRMKIDVLHANIYMGSLFFALNRLVVIGIAELAMTSSRLSVFYKQRDFYFYPAWAYAIPASLLKIPFSLLDSLIWTAITYYAIGYSPEPQRYNTVQIMCLLDIVFLSCVFVVTSGSSISFFFSFLYTKFPYRCSV